MRNEEKKRREKQTQEKREEIAGTRRCRRGRIDE
jgi:hypothetical protein